ncbi:MAG: winged helix-turn-helix transcriptional regulator [Eubacterium sp.]|nr:winged helix-turn-helix transcriptional regulator [Eubacterium sp.]
MLRKEHYHLILFCLYSYIYSMTLSFMNMRAVSVLGSEGSIVLFRTDLLPYVAGCLFYAAIRTLLSDKALIRKNFLTANAVSAAMPFFIMLVYTDNPAVFNLSAYILMFIIGILCCDVYLKMSHLFVSFSKTGFYYFVGASAAILIQYIFQAFIGNDNVTLYSLILITFITVFFELALGNGTTVTPDEKPEDSDKHSFNPEFKKLIITAILITICLELIGNFLTSSLIILVSENVFLTYSFPRLFFIFSYLLMGLMSDYKNMKLIPIITLCGMILGILNPIMFGDARYMGLNTCIYYVMAGIANSYLTLVFWKLAGKRRLAPFICVMGRIIDSIFSSIFSGQLLSSLPLPGIIAIELLVIIFMVIIFTYSGQLFLQDKPEAVTLSVRRCTPEEFAGEYGLSEKETLVLAKALTFHGPTTELAKELYMSRSVLYKHFNSICNKTGQESFAGVKQLFYETPGESISESIGESNSSKEYGEEDISIQEMSPEEKLEQFAKTYDLTDNEKKTLALFIENQDLTQNELAELRGITLRTIQRHLSSIRHKTGTASLIQLSSMYNGN